MNFGNLPGNNPGVLNQPLLSQPREYQYTAPEANVGLRVPPVRGYPNFNPEDARKSQGVYISQPVEAIPPQNLRLLNGIQEEVIRLVLEQILSSIEDLKDSDSKQARKCHPSCKGTKSFSSELDDLGSTLELNFSPVGELKEELERAALDKMLDRYLGISNDKRRSVKKGHAEDEEISTSEEIPEKQVTKPGEHNYDWLYSEESSEAKKSSKNVDKIKMEDFIKYMPKKLLRQQEQKRKEELRTSGFKYATQNYAQNPNKTTTAQNTQILKDTTVRAEGINPEMVNDKKVMDLKIKI